MPARDPDAEKLQRDFGQRVRRRRLQLVLSQETLAELAGIHRTSVGPLESGDRDPRLDTILRVADALDIDPGDLVTGLRLH